MSEAEAKSYSKAAVLERLRKARATREGERPILGWGLDIAAVFLLIAFGATLISILAFVAARFAVRVPTLVGWGYLAALAGFVLVPMAFVFFTSL